jgi:hypothetical protein
MISGTTAWSRFSVSVDLALVAGIVFTYASRGGDILLQRRYPDDTEYRNDMIWLPLSQEDTVKLRSRGEQCYVELQFNFKTGAVGKSAIFPICVAETLFTEFVDGNAPDPNLATGGVIGVSLDDVIVVNTGGGMSYNIGHGLKVDEATNTLLVDTANKVEADNTLPITAAAVHEIVGDIEAILSII